MEDRREYVGIDLHRRRSVIVRMDGEGTVLDSARIAPVPTAVKCAGRRKYASLPPRRGKWTVTQ